MGPDQVLVITPSNSITFEGTFKEAICKKITMRNPLQQNIAFKIKTTTPKQYCVRPSIGCIAPEQSKEISIILQPLQYTLSEKAKHKFMIQSTVISDEDVGNIDAVWKNAPPNVIMCSKLLSVLIQTNDKAKPKTDYHHDLAMDEMASFDDSPEHLLEEESNAKEIMESGDIIYGDVTDHNPVALSKLMDENGKLKVTLGQGGVGGCLIGNYQGQVATLKKIVFDNTYKWESLKAKQIEEAERSPGSGGLSQGVKNESAVVPLIVYQLIAFFLGLIIGKFLL